MNHIRCPSELQGKWQFEERSSLPCMFYAFGFINMGTFCHPVPKSQRWKKSSEKELELEQVDTEDVEKDSSHMLSLHKLLYPCKYNLASKNQQSTKFLLKACQLCSLPVMTLGRCYSKQYAVSERWKS